MNKITNKENSNRQNNSYKKDRNNSNQKKYNNQSVNSNNDVNTVGKIKKLFLEYVKYMRTYISLAVGLQ